MVSFRRTHYRISLRRFFARGAYRQEGPTGQRGLLASGGGFGPGGLPLCYAPGLNNLQVNKHWGCKMSIEVAKFKIGVASATTKVPIQSVTPDAAVLLYVGVYMCAIVHIVST